MKLHDWTPETMPLPRLAFFVGPNGAGKSWLLGHAVRAILRADPNEPVGRYPMDRAGIERFHLLQEVIGRGQHGTFAIEGIDQGLHLSFQYKLVEFCRLAVQTNPALRVWATCYSPFALESVPHESVFVLAADPGGVQHVQPLTAYPKFSRFGPFLTAGELWANVGEDWVFQEEKK